MFLENYEKAGCWLVVTDVIIILFYFFNLFFFLKSSSSVQSPTPKMSFVWNGSGDMRDSPRAGVSHCRYFKPEGREDRLETKHQALEYMNHSKQREQSRAESTRPVQNKWKHDDKLLLSDSEDAVTSFSMMFLLLSQDQNQQGVYWTEDRRMWFDKITLINSLL